MLKRIRKTKTTVKVFQFLIQDFLQNRPYYQKRVNFLAKKLKKKHKINKIRVKHLPFISDYLFLKYKGVSCKELRKRNTIEIKMFHHYYYFLLDSILEARGEPETYKTIWLRDNKLLTKHPYDARALRDDFWKLTKTLILDLNKFENGLGERVLKIFEEANKNGINSVKLERAAGWGDASFADCKRIHEKKAILTGEKVLEGLLVAHNQEPNQRDCKAYKNFFQSMLVLDDFVDLCEDYKGNTANIFISASREVGEKLKTALANQTVPTVRKRKKWLKTNFPKTHDKVFAYYNTVNKSDTREMFGSDWSNFYWKVAELIFRKRM